MARPSRPWCVALAAATLLASACSDDPPARRPITHLALPADAKALVVLGPGRTGNALFSVAADGALAPVGQDGDGLPVPLPLRLPSGDWIDFIHGPVPVALVPLGGGAFAAAFGGSADPRNPPEAAYARIATHVAAGGALTVLPVDLNPASPPELQADAGGRLYFADLVTLFGSAPPTLRPVVLEDGAARLDWPISASGDRLTSFAVDHAGNVAYRAAREPGGGAVAVLRPVMGPIVTWALAAPADVGSFWRGADGHLYVTRAAPAEPGTTELLRVDFGLETVATPVAAWTGAPGLLHGEPLALGDARAFVRGAEVVLLRAGAPPEVHALGLAPSAVRASSGALWIVGAPASDGPRWLVRWTPGGLRPTAERLLDDVFDVDAAAPYDDGHAIAGVTRRSDGARLLLRVAAQGSAEPIDAGPAVSHLVDAVLLR